jgi:putative DNA primase/helicase
MVTELLSRFDGVRQSGRGWTARCPAHDDQRSSLSISHGDTQPWVLKCHAGCSADAIVEAAGLTMADIHEPRGHENGSKQIVATYDYTDEFDVPLYQVVRFEPKDFRQRRATKTGWTWKLDDVRRVLYRLPHLRSATVYIVEGEKDADRLAALKVPATTNAGGAGKWKREYTQQLTGAGVENVVILPDNDATGRKHAEDVARSCSAVGLKVKVVFLPDLPEKGDISTWFDAGHTRDELAALVTRTDLYSPPAVTVTSPDQATKAGTDTGPTPTAPILIRLADVQSETIDWIWKGRYARGKKTLIAGDPGLGKSSFLFDSAARITRGAAWPDGGYAAQGNVLFLLAEDGIADTVRPRIDDLGGDCNRVFILDGVTDASGAPRPVNLARDLAALEAAIAEVKPVLVVIDPITAFLGKTDSYKDAEVRGLLAPLLATISRQRCALVTVAHLAKDQTRAALHRPGGSIAFVAAARLAFVLAADPQDDTRRVLAPIKANICQKAPSLSFRFPDGVLTWDASVATDLDAETLLRPAPADERDARADAETVLRGLLDDHSLWPLDATRAAKEGAAHNISQRTLQRTAGKLGIRMSRVGFGDKGRWVWHRPIGDIPDTASSPPVRVSSMASMAKPSARRHIHT